MNKKILGLVAVLVVGLVLVVSYSHRSPAPLKGVVNNTANTYSSGICLGNRPVCENFVGGKIEAKTNQASFRNTTGGPLFIDFAEVATDGTASSSYKIYVASSSAATIANDFAAPTATSIYLNGIVLATSTAATSTTNYDPANTGAANGSKSFRLADGAYMVVQIQAKDSNACGVAGTCETATSTNRGFNAFWFLRYHQF